MHTLSESLLLLRLVGVVGIGYSWPGGGSIDGIRRRPGSHRATTFGGLFPLHLQLLGLPFALLAGLEFFVLSGKVSHPLTLQPGGNMYTLSIISWILSS